MIVSLFSQKSPNFWAQVTIAILGLFAMLGVQFPSSPEVLGPEIINTLSTGGVLAVVFSIGISVLMPIINFARNTPGSRWRELLTSPNTFVYVLTAVFGLLTVTGFVLPDGTAEQIVSLIYAKNWVGLGGLIFSTIVPLVIRLLFEKNTAIKASATDAKREKMKQAA